MQERNGLIGTAMSEEESRAIDRENFFVKIRLEFGPAFSPQKSLTLGELCRLLDKHAEHYKESFMGDLLKFFAEHHRAIAEQQGEKEEAVESVIQLDFGGCHTCGSDGEHRGWVCTPYHPQHPCNCAPC